MDIKIQIIVAVVVFVALFIIVNMIRKKELELQYALSWLLLGLGILILDCFPQLLTWISNVMGIANPTNTLFFLGFCFSLVIIFILTVTISRMSNKIKNLAQELALLSDNAAKK